MEKLIAAALSPSFVPGDKQRNLEAAHRGLLAAKAKGVELAVFSEWYLTNCLDQRSYEVAGLDPAPFIARRADVNYPLKKRRPELYAPLLDAY